MEDLAISSQYVTLAEGVIASDYALKNLNKALGEAQSEFTPSIKSEENKYGGYKYTPLSAIVSACRPSLTKHHLTVSQIPVADLENKTLIVYSRLVHWDSGEWMQAALELPAELALGKGGTPVFNQQTIGGTQTYVQKYAYKGILGIPDAEEMIDSTEEKGDLPSRSKNRTLPSTPESAALNAEAERVKWLELITPTTPEQFLHDVTPKIKAEAESFLRCVDKNLLTTVFNRLQDAEVFSAVLTPLFKVADDVDRKSFIHAVAAEAKSRKYTVNRATGAYGGSTK